VGRHGPGRGVLLQTKLALQLTNDDMAYPGTYMVTVFNPAPGGGLSNAKPFSVKYKPLVKSLRLPSWSWSLPPAAERSTSYWESWGAS